MNSEDAIVYLTSLVAVGMIVEWKTVVKMPIIIIPIATNAVK